MSEVVLEVLPTQVSTLMPADTYKLTSHHTYIYTALYLPKATTQTSRSTQERGGGGEGWGGGGAWHRKLDHLVLKILC